VRHRLTLMKPRPNRRCGRSFETTTLDQQRAERGAAGSWGPLVADFPGTCFLPDSRLAPLSPSRLRIF
jgi:hypothetical protein